MATKVRKVLNSILSKMPENQKQACIERMEMHVAKLMAGNPELREKDLDLWEQIKHHLQDTACCDVPRIAA